LLSRGEEVSAERQFRENHHLRVGTLEQGADTIAIGSDVPEDRVHLNDGDVHRKQHENSAAKYNGNSLSSERVSPEPVAMDSTLVNAMLMLAASIAVLVLVAALVRRLASSRGIAQGIPIRIVARQPIAGKAMLVVADIGDKRLLLGVTEHSVTLLATLAAGVQPVQQPAPSKQPSAAPTVSPAELSFRAYLSSMFQRSGK
jgi:flagellar biogenesis protein FliO